MRSTVKSNIFIDSNIWIYAFLDSEKDHAKQQRVLSLLEGIPADSTVISSVQVLRPSLCHREQIRLSRVRPV